MSTSENKTRQACDVATTAPEGFDNLIKVRCWTAFKRRLTEHAESRGEEFSHWVRRALRNQMDREATDVVAGPLFLDPADVAEMAKAPPASGDRETED